jgi:ketosteroid isomerase-like protein
MTAPGACIRYRPAGLLAVLFIVCATHVSLGATKDHEAVLHAERRWSEALVKQDVSALKELYADDLVYVHSGGNRETKTEFIRRVETGGLKYDSLELVNPEVRMYGDVAIVNGMFDVRVTSDGSPINTRVVYIHVYARQAGTWRMVAHQTTRAPQPTQ